MLMFCFFITRLVLPAYFLPLHASLLQCSITVVSHCSSSILDNIDLLELKIDELEFGP